MRHPTHLDWTGDLNSARSLWRKTLVQRQHLHAARCSDAKLIEIIRFKVQAARVKDHGGHGVSPIT